MQGSQLWSCPFCSGVTRHSYMETVPCPRILLVVLSLCVASAIPVCISCSLYSWAGLCGPAEEHFAEVRCCITLTCSVLERGHIACACRAGAWSYPYRACLEVGAGPQAARSCPCPFNYEVMDSPTLGLSSPPAFAATVMIVKVELMRRAHL